MSRPSVARRMLKCAQRDMIRLQKAARNDPTPVNCEEAAQATRVYVGLCAKYQSGSL